MNHDLKVDHGGLDMASGDITSSANTIQERLTTLESDIRSKVAPNWTGEANTSFVASKAKWDQGMDELRNLLAMIGTSVGTANSEYRATDARSANRFAH